MKQTDPSFNEYPLKGWQLLGKLKLSKELDIEAAIYSWLLEILRSLNLHENFFNKLVLSIQNAAMKLLEPSLATQGFEHIHLLVFVRGKDRNAPYSWGFFRIEKIEVSTTENSPPDHAVEFYLYPE